MFNKPHLKQFLKVQKFEYSEFIDIEHSTSIVYIDSVYLQKEKQLNIKKISKILYKIIKYLSTCKTIANTISKQIKIEFRKFGINIIYLK
jgi:hypothetical protein